MQQKIFRVGLTGNIGSGKSTVARLFQRLGIPVYFADQRAKELMTQDPELQEGIIAAFGSEAYVDYRSSKAELRASPSATNHFTLNRAFLAAQVFTNDQKLAQLNALVHPAVAKDALAWHEAQQNVPYTLYEAAITFETGGYKVLDKVIVVSAPESLRLQRVIDRDHSNAKQVKARMAKQWLEERKLALADFVIQNDGSQLLLPQVLRVHRELGVFAGWIVGM